MCSRASQHILPVLILGVGNILMGDDGLGVAVIHQLQRGETPASIHLLDAGSGLGKTVSVLAKARSAIFIDAICADEEPGTVVRTSLAELHPQARPVSHALSIDGAVAAARIIDQRPARVSIWGIVPEYVGPRRGLSPAVEQAVPAAARAVMADALSHCQQP